MSLNANWVPVQGRPLQHPSNPFWVLFRLPSPIWNLLALAMSYRATRSINLQFIPVGIHDFAKLTSLPSLETLEIVLDSNLGVNALANRRDERATSAKTFASLKDLNFTVGSIQRYESLASFKFPALEALRLVFQTSAESTLSQPHLAIIASQCNPEVLSALTIQDDRDDLELEDVALVTSPTIAISPSHLRHVLAFRALRHFAVFASPWVTEYDDPILLDIATSWPKLEYLDLNTEVWKAAGCPELWSLALLLDARGCVQYDELVDHADAGRDSDDGEVCDLDLETLVLAWSPIAEPEKVTAALSYVLLPNVEIRHGGIWVQRNMEEYRWGDVDQELKEFSSQWKTVESLLPIFYRVREAERERARRLVEQGKSGLI
ncbi:hypothetical protein DAEQUDRAFT_759123 [Daedalea quercina L-15889]|uniref:F-box domain-containing protein n=1 Tax=Daedalea quercina L-15889 TaxID=1314783 RepID=A0A165ML10_9APHY|nr:hypothetical protein DAEQUDRAFT_759123 [Daedalea quercina L-15889]